jgi:hypothetical protein
MQIPDEEIARYQAFVSQVAKSLGSLIIDPETVLWHYTTGNGLLGIIKSNTLYSTQVSCLNDSTEVRYASKVFRDALAGSRESYAPNSPQRVFIDTALTFFAEDSNIPNHVRLPYFVTCFTEARDDLSQWRAYGGGENGYALAFKAKNLLGISSSLLARVVYYSSEMHSSLAEVVAEQTVKFFTDGLEKFGAQDVNEWMTSYLEVWDQVITQIAPLIKDPGFDSEREFRLVKSYQIEDLKDLQFVQKAAMLSRHLPLQPAPNATDPYKLPIHEILVGPCRYPHVSRISIGTLLQQSGYAKVPVNISRSPFQAT